MRVLLERTLVLGEQNVKRKDVLAKVLVMKETEGKHVSPDTQEDGRVRRVVARASGAGQSMCQDKEYFRMKGSDLDVTINTLSCSFTDILNVHCIEFVSST